MHKVALPARDPAAQEHDIWERVHSVVIVGANGSGKSRLGVWIESNSQPFTHRITAQRALSIPVTIPLQQYEQAESFLHYGSYDPRKPERAKGGKFNHRWGQDHTNQLLDDYQHLLSLLFADASRRDREYAAAAMQNVPTTKPPKCKLDIVQDIWLELMPQRKLVIGSDKLDAATKDGTTYAAREMSDGERVAIYLIGQALCAPEGAIVVIDEPEIHLHRAIQASLWDRVEDSRPDCVFVYITHDLEFAATRKRARKIWVKSYRFQHWEWEELEADPALPDALLFQVLGNRRPTLFVEGDETSYDVATYSALFPNHLVIPRQTCDKVIEATKAMAGLSTLHHLAIQGLVDRDRREDDEIAALRGRGVWVADVAEVENLLCLPEAVDAVANRLGATDIGAARSKVENAVLDELEKVVEQQAFARALAEIQFRMNGFGPRIGQTDAAKLAADLQAYVNGIDVEARVLRAQKLFTEIVSARDYRAALRYFNSKGIPAFVAGVLGVRKEVFAQMVLNTIRTDPNGPAATAMRNAVMT